MSLRLLQKFSQSLISYFSLKIFLFYFSLVEEDEGDFDQERKLKSTNYLMLIRY